MNNQRIQSLADDCTKASNSGQAFSFLNLTWKNLSAFYYTYHK